MRTVKHFLISLLLKLALLLTAVPVFAESLYSYAFINDDGTLSIRNKIVHLYGIYIPPGGNNCRTNQLPPVCGSRAVLALEFKIKGFVYCEVVDENSDGSLTGQCFANHSNFDQGEDLSAYLLERGWAVALPDAPFEYHTLERIAASRSMGIWGIPVDRPSINPFK